MIEGILIKTFRSSDKRSSPIFCKLPQAPIYLSLILLLSGDMKNSDRTLCSLPVSANMPIPLNRVILDTIAEVDFLACLSLTNTSNTLRSFILDNVITPTSLCRFLQANQYLLHHDIYRRFISPHEGACLRRAVETLRHRSHRNEDSFYTKILPTLGPLLAITPQSYFERTPPLDPGFRVPGIPDRKGRRFGFIVLDVIREMYEYRLLQWSWLHFPPQLRHAGVDFTDEFQVVHYSDNPYLQDQLLFCGRYMSESRQCYKSLWTFEFSTEDSKVEALAKVNNLRNGLKNLGLTLLHEKRTIQACFYFAVAPYTLQVVSADNFLSFFRLPEWMELWTPDELGWWCSFGLSKYGSALQPLVDLSFKNTTESLLWLFLGAHHWLHPRDNSRDSLLNSDLEARKHAGKWSCCANFPDGLEREPVSWMIKPLSQKTRIGLMEDIVRKAPEFGQCRDLGGNLFNYFVISADSKDIDLMFSVLLQEITDSPMQYLFEHSVGLAISYYMEEHDLKKLPWNLAQSMKYLCKLERKNRELYRVLLDFEIDSLESREFYRVLSDLEVDSLESQFSQMKL